MRHPALLALATLVVLLVPQLQLAAQDPPPPPPVEEAAPPVDLASPSPDDDGLMLEHRALLYGAGFGLGTSLLAPLPMMALNDDMGYGEGVLISMASMLGAASLGLGVGLLVLGFVIIDEIWGPLLDFVEIPIIGIIIGIPLVVVAAAFTAVALGVGGGLTLASPFILGGGMTAIDDAFGADVDNVLTLTLTSTLSAGLGMGSFLLWREIDGVDDDMAFGMAIGTSVLLTTLSYGIFRQTKDKGSAPTMVMSPLLTF